MSRDLDDLFDRAASGPAPPVDLDRVVARGVRRRRLATLGIVTGSVAVLVTVVAVAGSLVPARMPLIGTGPELKLTVETGAGPVDVTFSEYSGRWCAAPTDAPQLSLCRTSEHPPWTEQRWWNVGVQSVSPGETLTDGWSEAVHWGFTTGSATVVAVQTPSGEPLATGQLVDLDSDLQGFLVAVPAGVVTYDIEIRGGADCQLFLERTVLEVRPDERFTTPTPIDRRSCAP